nr:hypothetical protein [Tanacetum cinerariifolium]
MGDRVMCNNSQGKKQKVEDQRRSVKFSKYKTSVTACNDSLNAKTLNVNFVCATCGKCMLNEKQDMCILKSINGVNSRTKMPIAMPVSTREPKCTVKQSVDKPLKKRVASESNHEPRNITRKLCERVILLQLVEIVLFIVDSGCSKHMTGNLKLLINFVEKFMGMVKFGNDLIASILGYGDLVQGAVTIKRSTCFIRDLKRNDLLTGSYGTDLYLITLQDTNSPNIICLVAKATSSQAWLWHRRLSHLNFDTINLLSKNDIVVGLPKLKLVKHHLCSSCELGKAKRKSFHTKITPSSKRRLQLLHMDLCGPMRVASINGKRYVLVIVDDYSRYTWTHFLRGEFRMKFRRENDDLIMKTVAKGSTYTSVKALGDENPIHTLGDYSKPSHEGYKNTIELPVGNKVYEIDCVDDGKLRNKNAEESWEIIENLALYDHEGWNDTKEFAKQVKAISTPQGTSKNMTEDFLSSKTILTSYQKGTTFEARVRDSMVEHTERKERFENAIFKQREEINNRISKMFGLLNELTTSKTLEKVLMREEVEFLVTKNVNSISLVKGEEERSDKIDVATGTTLKNQPEQKWGCMLRKPKRRMKLEKKK